MTLSINTELVIDGNVHTIIALNGRWVKLSNGANISRAQAEAGIAEYAADRKTLGPEFEAEQTDATPTPSKAQYFGPMLALRTRAKSGAYLKAPNGQPSCGDDIAQILGALKPEYVIRACIVALNLPSNPYLHLNVGQQSMNLRNRVRGAIIRGEFGMGVVREAAEDAAISQNVAYISSPAFAAAQADITAKQAATA